MNVVEFIPYLRDSEKIKQFLNQYYPEIDYYDAEVYLKATIDKESNIEIFDCEKIEGLIEMQHNDNKYYSFYSLDHLLDVFKSYSKTSDNDSTIAQRIIDYRINDA